MGDVAREQHGRPGSIGGLGTSAARLRRPDASTNPSASAGALPKDAEVVARVAELHHGAVLWNEPRLARLDVAPSVAKLPREAASLETAAPGRPRLLYPRHWQSPYASGNRYADLFERGTIDWLTRFGLIVTAEDLQTIKEFECGLYGGLSSPTSSLRDGLLITQFVSLWLYFDDRVIEDSTAFDLDDPVGSMGTQAASAPTAFMSAWNDLCARLRQTQSESWMQRLGSALRAWIENARLETRNAKTYRSTGVMPDFSTMLEIRTISIGMYPTFYLLEMAEGFELPQSVHECTPVVELKRMASRLVGYGNDIGGLAKDLAGNWPNLVVALKQERGIALEEAFAAVAGMHNTDVEAFDQVEMEIPSFGPDMDLQIQGWVQAVRYSVLGFTLWESLAVRYQKWKAMAGGRVLTAPVTVFTPAGVNPGGGSSLDDVRVARFGA